MRYDYIQEHDGTTFSPHTQILNATMPRVTEGRTGRRTDRQRHDDNSRS